jgi:formamidopyrimidine-DNA glycosylase
MPEGPEVHSSAKILNKSLSGLFITKVEYTDFFNDKKGVLDTSFLDSDLPLLLEEVYPRAKRTNFICTNSKDEGSIIVFFYAMQGRLCFKHRGKPQIILTFSKKVDGKMKEVETLFYEDNTRLGFVKYATSVESIDDIYKGIGPDFTNGGVTLEEFTVGVNNKRIPYKTVAEFLLEQKRFSGIGNYLRAEILYDAKISPYRELQDFTDESIEILFNSINKIMKLSIEKGGMTSQTYLDPFGEPGKFEPIIYGMAKDIEGFEVISEKIGKVPKGKDNRRTIWWCPDVQL